MRISDWSSDVCSSDLLAHAGEDQLAGPALLGNEIGDPARALRLLPNPDGLQELNAPAGEHAPRQRNRRHEFAAQGMAVRSEEHTSELQSLMRISYAVFCLKKKKKQQTTPQQ